MNNPTIVVVTDRNDFSLNPDVIFIPVDLKEQYESDAKPKLDAA